MALTERDLENPDPLRLDREIRRTAEGVRSWRRRLRGGEGLLDDPFWATRLVTTRTAFRAVSELPATDPLRPALLDWIYVLSEQRINRAALAQVAEARYVTEQVVPAPERAKMPLARALQRALSEPARRDAWLEAFVRGSGDLADGVAALWERRQEMAIRMGLPGPDAIESPCESTVQEAARWLDDTRDWLDGGPRTLDELVTLASAEGAVEGWPRHLLPRTILDLFRDTDLFRGLTLEPGELPELRSPSSFVRAIARVGAAWVDATAPTDQPFVVAHDPYGLRRYTMGALLGTLPASPVFSRRAFGLAATKLDDHARSLGTSLLIESRIAALRVLLRPAALAGRNAFREAFERETHRAFGFAVSPRIAGAIFQLRTNDAQRFSGLLASASLAAKLRDAHDDDWFRNPRAIEQLRDEARLSPERKTTAEALAAGAQALREHIGAVIG